MTTLDPTSQAYADRFEHGRKTSTVLGRNHRYAVTHAVFAGSHEDLLSRLKSADDARYHALLFSADNLLRKFSPADPAWIALEDYVQHTVPATARYW